jgi:hypothetical protein
VAVGGQVEDSAWEITERFDGLGRANQKHGPPGPMGMQHSLETSRKGKGFVGTPACEEKVSREDHSTAASSLTRWGGCAAILGGLSTTFVWGLLPPPSSPNEGE